jgi:hypothetical protein
MCRGAGQAAFPKLIPYCYHKNIKIICYLYVFETIVQLNKFSELLKYEKMSSSGCNSYVYQAHFLS